MAKTYGNGQAYPRSYATGLINLCGQHELKSVGGLTKREEFAKAILAGFCSNPHEDIRRLGGKKLAEWACMQTDELIEALNKCSDKTPKEEVVEP